MHILCTEPPQVIHRDLKLENILLQGALPLLPLLLQGALPLLPLFPIQIQCYLKLTKLEAAVTSLISPPPLLTILSPRLIDPCKTLTPLFFSPSS